MTAPARYQPTDLERLSREAHTEVADVIRYPTTAGGHVYVFVLAGGRQVVIGGLRHVRDGFYLLDALWRCGRPESAILTTGMRRRVSKSIVAVALRNQEVQEESQ